MIAPRLATLPLPSEIRRPVVRLATLPEIVGEELSGPVDAASPASPTLSEPPHGITRVRGGQYAVLP